MMSRVRDFATSQARDRFTGPGEAGPVDRKIALRDRARGFTRPGALHDLRCTGTPRGFPAFCGPAAYKPPGSVFD